MLRSNMRIFGRIVAVGVLGLMLEAPVFARDWDNNPPGPVGGRGTNWENPPGPIGGPGTSPNRRHWRRNPPGPIGGPGAGPRWH